MINVTRSSLPPFEEYCEEIKDIWDSHWLTNMGIKHKMLESKLRQYLDTPFITLFTNGHLALESIIAVMELSGEVITTPFTFASTAHAISRNGLTPVFCDINPFDYTIDVSKIEMLITDKTTAIIPVHVYGNLCDVDTIDSIAQKYNLKVIYDAAHAFSVSKGGINASKFGDASMFSFHATKVFNTIEGGAVSYSNGMLKDKLDYIKNFGITGPDEVICIGGNAKMNEFQAAMGICNLRHVDDEIAKREKVAAYYSERLSGVKGIILSRPQTGVKCNYAYYPVLFDGYIYNRDDVYHRLYAKEIYARKYFYPTINHFECYKSKYHDIDTPIAMHIASNILTLPMYADLQIDDVNRICDIILGID
jgi:dTDP-4-amino-4,6-dideoxygalactose transaminase